jgi:hypothetical protein
MAVCVCGFDSVAIQHQYINVMDCNMFVGVWCITKEEVTSGTGVG